MTKEEKADALVAEMTKARGYMYPEWEFAARNDPDFMKCYNDLYASALGDGEALPLKTRELVALGILCYRRSVDAAATHIVRALKNGATKQEILEAIETCIIPGGAPTFSAGLLAMMQGFEMYDKQVSGK
jgi:alkylhydroperoxidase/carboxymuconolactone decarboxylase family protein YurZ